jgi:phage terminase small subunit
VQQFPQVAIAHKLGALLTRLEAEFGLTPSSRSRIQSSKPNDDHEDPLAEFLRPAI